MGVDLCILRHPKSVIRELADSLPKMVFINAGEGSISHPTQALLDIKTIIDHKNSLDGLKIVIVGDLIIQELHHLLWKVFQILILILFLVVILKCVQSIKIQNLGIYEPDLEKALQDSDVVMTLRIQYERFEKI